MKKLELHERRSGAERPDFQQKKTGSMYSLLGTFSRKKLQKQAYVLANELAKVKGEAFEMPERSTKYRCLWINQGPAVYTACYVPSRA